MPMIFDNISTVNVQEVLCPNLERIATVTKLNTITTSANSLKIGKVNLVTLNILDILGG